MKNSLIVRIAEGLGNQLFMYANAISLSNKINYDLYVDNESGYFKKKDIRNFELDKFNLSAPIVDDKFKFNNHIKNLRRKFLIRYDLFRNKKKFILENKYENKKTRFEEIRTDNLSEIIYIEGNYESEKYFEMNRSLILEEFKIKNNDQLKKNNYYDLITKNKDRVISICVRANRYSERIKNKTNQYSKIKSDEFTKNNIDYIYRAIKNLPKKIENPIYLLWSNDFHNLEEYFPNDQFIFVRNKDDKIITDFYLLTLCKNFIVAPTSFHWWGAWLSQEYDKLCIKPKNINQSSNIDFWPEKWISL